MSVILHPYVDCIVVISRKINVSASSEMPISPSVPAKRRKELIRLKSQKCRL